jgi:hypothetical protein
MLEFWYFRVFAEWAVWSGIPGTEWWWLGRLWYCGVYLAPTSGQDPGLKIYWGFSWVVWAIVYAFSCSACRWQHALGLSALSWRWTVEKQENGLPFPGDLTECQPPVSVSMTRVFLLFSLHILFFSIIIDKNHVFSFVFVCWFSVCLQKQKPNQWNQTFS